MDFTAGGVLARLLSWSIRGGYALALLASFLLYMQPLRASVAELIWAKEAGAPQAGTRPRLADDEATPGLLPVVGGPLQYSRSDPGRGTSNSSGSISSMRASAPGSAFAAPGVQAAAAAAGVQLGAADAAAAASAARVLSACDSFDNPRAGSFSRIHFGRHAGSLHAAAQQQPQHPEQQPPPAAWQVAEQRWYFPLTYGLLVVMVVLATAVPNIWVALSAIGEFRCCLQAAALFCLSAGLQALVACRTSSKATPLKTCAMPPTLPGCLGAALCR